MESREATTSPAVNQNGMNNHHFDQIFQLNPPPIFEVQAPPPAESRAVRNSPVTNVVCIFIFDQGFKLES